jgi:hypothetical protein
MGMSFFENVITQEEYQMTKAMLKVKKSAEMIKNKLNSLNPHHLL